MKNHNGVEGSVHNICKKIINLQCRELLQINKKIEKWTRDVKRYLEKTYRYNMSIDIIMFSISIMMWECKLNKNKK